MINSSILVIVIALVTFLLIIRLWLNEIKSKSQNSDELIAWLKELGQRVEDSTLNVDQKLSKNMEMFNNRLDKAAFVIGEVQKSLGQFSEIGRSMQELQVFLQSPKLRGNIGEQILKELLSLYFPKDCYVLQYTFKNGERVDAVIKTSQGLIPIDSKFPIDNFRKISKAVTSEERDKVRKEFAKDVKKHIQDIARKYILVGENTSDYALMYIPSEAVYYEIINDADLFDYSGKQRVLPVSPMSFYAYMKAILMSLEGQRIQSQAKEIIEILKSMKKDYEKTEESMSVLNKHLTNAYNQSNQVVKNLLYLGQKLSSTRVISSKDQHELLD